MTTDLFTTSHSTVTEGYQIKPDTIWQVFVQRSHISETCCLEIVEAESVSKVSVAVHARAGVIVAVLQPMAQGRNSMKHSATPLLSARQSLLISQRKLFKESL